MEKNLSIATLESGNGLRKKRLILIAEMLASYAEVFPAYGKEVTPERCRIYDADLADIPLEALGEAMLAARRAAKEFPTPAHIREHYTGRLPPRVKMAWE